MKMRMAVGLVHWPIRDRQGTTVATNVTNLDVHDIARASRVYAVEKYFVIHPSKEQLMFVARLLDHWRVGEGKRMNPMRATALTMVETATDVDHAVRQFDPDTLVIGTTARNIEGVKRVGFKTLRTFIETGDTKGIPPEISEKMAGKSSVLLLFGTGFGMTEELLKSCHLLLEPLKGAPPLDYRHLSVRSAVSICLDRLLGAW